LKPTILSIVRLLCFISFTFAFIIESPPAHASCISALKKALQYLSEAPKPLQSIKHTQFIELSAEIPSGARINKLKRGEIKKIPYIITQSNEQKIWFLNQEFHPPQDTYFLTRINKNNTPIEEGAILEHGYLTIHENQLVYHQTHGFELSQSELNHIYRQVDAGSPTPTIRHIKSADRNFVKSKILKCQDVFDIKRSKKNFFTQLFGVEMTLLSASILMTKPQYFYDSSNWNLLGADYSGSAARKGVNGMVSYMVTTNGMPYMKRIGIRQGNAMFSAMVQHLIYGSITDVNTTQITLFNMGYSSLSVFKTDFLDNVLLHHIPNKAYDACLKNRNVPIYYSQTGIRIMEDLGSKMIYFSLRPLFVDEID